MNKIVLVLLITGYAHAFSLQCTIKDIWVEITNQQHLIGKKFTAITGDGKLIINGAINDVMYYNREDTLSLRRYPNEKLFSYRSKKFYIRAVLFQINRYEYKYQEDEGVTATCYKK